MRSTPGDPAVEVAAEAQVAAGEEPKVVVLEAEVVAVILLPWTEVRRDAFLSIYHFRCMLLDVN